MIMYIYYCLAAKEKPIVFICAKDEVLLKKRLKSLNESTNF